MRLLPGMIVLTALLAARGHADDSARHMLWVAEGESNRVYLLGSMHLLREEDYPLPAAMDAAYADAETLALEIDLNALNALYVLRTMRALAMPEDGRSLKEQIGDKHYAEAVKLTTALNIDLQLIDEVEPWFAALTAVQMHLSRLKYRADLGIDQTMAARARADSKPVIGLETLEFQLGIFDSMPLDLQSEFLLATLREQADLEQQIADLHAAWKSGDSDTLATLINGELAARPDLYEQLIVARNRRWMVQVQKWLTRDDDVLLVAGAGHMVGDDGLVQSLRKLGVRVIQQ